jgi:hypothetical protein|tara:strand:- start:721 stop:1038 length:318 start_codon:yes stop_codon:yes gene_type:complete
MGVRSTTETKTDSRSIKLEIIAAGRKAVKQLIKVAKEDIIKPDPDDELAADRLKNAAATKKLAIFDAFEILNRIDSEQEALDLMFSSSNSKAISSNQGFAERRSK